ncbi:MAG: phosphate acyltransferase PlsX, partial [Desulfuromonadaceae bacterium]
MNRRIVVAVDAMGGDHSPGVEVEGAVAAGRKWQIPIVLVGDSVRIEEELKRHRVDDLDISIRHASEVVGMQDSPSDAIRKKKDSSIRVAFNLLKNGEAQAVVSAGNSGATMAAGMFVLGRIKGIDRPAIATIFPNLKDSTLVLDVGGNVDCKPQHLAQFALMGEVYARHIMGKPAPRVGLLSNGEEESKGNELTRESHRLLKGTLSSYVGYIEGRDVFNGMADVVVCDGFVGNVVLKLSEGLADAIGSMLKKEIRQCGLAKLGYLLAKPAFKAFKKKVDYA